MNRLVRRVAPRQVVPLRVVDPHLLDHLSTAPGRLEPFERLVDTGLRLNELLRLRIKDADLERRQVVVRGGKGDNYAKVVVM